MESSTAMLLSTPGDTHSEEASDEDYVAADEHNETDSDTEDRAEAATLLNQFFRHGVLVRSAASRELPPVPREWPDLEGDLAQELTALTDARVRHADPLLYQQLRHEADGGSDSGSGMSSTSTPRPPTSQVCTGRVVVAVDTPSPPRRPQKAPHRRAAPIEGARVFGVNTAALVHSREVCGGFSASACRHLTATRHLPTQPHRVVDAMSSRAYIGQFTPDGALFVAAFQDKRVRVYGVERDWALVKDVRARLVRWTITDTAVSPDQALLVYSSINSTVHMMRLGGGTVDSSANVTDVHEGLAFNAADEDDDSGGYSDFGIWSVQWSADGDRLIAGTSHKSLVLYDVATRTPEVEVTAHRADVNAVTYMDAGSNLIATGSDDASVKLWDRRTLDSRAGRKPVGYLIGHTEGVTHLDSRGDGRYLISNCKDQSIKLWDVRRMLDAEHGPPPSLRWDYRWEDYPARGRLVVHPHDCSLMSYRGHSVRSTLIRAYFSPMATTGQRYIYAGSFCGTVHVFDVLTGRVVEALQHHAEVVRDCSWHPTKQQMASVSWDGTVVAWRPLVEVAARQFAMNEPPGDMGW